jgi:hypothetical protein
MVRTTLRTKVGLARVCVGHEFRLIAIISALPNVKYEIGLSTGIFNGLTVVDDQLFALLMETGGISSWLCQI